MLDWWPFERGLRLVEKLPFFAASVAVSIVTLMVHQHDAALPSIELLPVGVRFENALISYAAYIGDMFWPVNLAVFYPYGSSSLVVPAIFAGLALVGVTAAVLVFRRRRYLAVGWFWYVVMLVPVIGLLQAGAQTRADRFTYLPMIGLSMALVWGISEALAGRPRIQIALAAAVCAGCIALSWIQVGYWRDSITLYRHAIAVTPENSIMRFNLASALESKGDREGAIGELRETVRIRPNFASAHAELGQLLAKEGHSAEALAELRIAVALRPGDADAHLRLGTALGQLGDSGAAAVEISRAIAIQPANADAHYNLALALGHAGNLEEAVREFSEAVRLSPDDAVMRFNFGIALARLQRFPEAAAQFQEAVRIKPDFAEARQALEDARGMK
jgi:Flp pilus assembly protein TadD